MYRYSIAIIITFVIIFIGFLAKGQNYYDRNKVRLDHYRQYNIQLIDSSGLNLNRKTIKGDEIKKELENLVSKLEIKPDTMNSYLVTYDNLQFSLNYYGLNKYNYRKNFGNKMFFQFLCYVDESYEAHFYGDCQIEEKVDRETQDITVVETYVYSKECALLSTKIDVLNKKTGLKKLMLKAYEGGKLKNGRYTETLKDKTLVEKEIDDSFYFN